MCPECRQPLVALELDGIEIDRCLRCGGTWLDFGELEELAARAASPDSQPTDLLTTPSTWGKRTARRCPRCRRRLRRASLSASPELQLDRCPDDQGLWLDEGELAALLRVPDAGAVEPWADFLRELCRFETSSPS